ncbi:hypothetical protein HQ529_02690 [Candidatus Woesearchaeota archaeon]|nr:hypothetical protein [Candidatus Woesearchaeota archaeon]
MNQENELKNTFIEEYSSAKMLKKQGRLKSAVILISKSLFVLCDYIIFRKYKKLSKNHADRFRILQLKENKIYLEVDSVWSKYTDTYSKPSNYESYDILNKAIINIIENEELDKEIREIIEK